MFLNFVEHYKKSRPLSQPRRGFVVDNDDPRQLKRIRVAIEGLLEGPASSLPWISPANPGRGGGPASADSAVPDLGSEVSVEFPTGEIYFGFYTGHWTSEFTKPGLGAEDYPESEVTQDEGGTKIVRNKARGTETIYTAGGAVINCLDDGSIEIVCGRKLSFVSEDGKSSAVYDMEAGEFKTNAKEVNELAGAETKITSTELTLEVGQVLAAIEGAAQFDVGGGLKFNSGSFSQSVAGNYGLAVAGMSNTLMAQLVTETYGMGRIKNIVTVGEIVNILAGSYLLNVAAGPVTINGTILNLSALTMINMMAAAVAQILAPMVMIGPGVLPAPAVTILSDPLEDFITGKPKIGNPTVMIG